MTELCATSATIDPPPYIRLTGPDLARAKSGQSSKAMCPAGRSGGPCTCGHVGTANGGTGWGSVGGGETIVASVKMAVFKVAIAIVVSVATAPVGAAAVRQVGEWRRRVCRVGTGLEACGGLALL